MGKYRATYFIKQYDPSDGKTRVMESGFTDASSVHVKENLIEVYFGGASFLVIPIQHIVGEFEVVAYLPEEE